MSTRAAARVRGSSRLRRHRRRRLRRSRSPAGGQRVVPPGGPAAVHRPARCRGRADVRADAVAYGAERSRTTRERCRRWRRAPCLWGNTPDVLRRCARSAALFARRFEPRGFPVPRRCRAGDSGAADGGRAWLLKPVRSGGGRGVRRWRGAALARRVCYVQRYVDGVPGSVVFVAAAGRRRRSASPGSLSATPAFGASGFALLRQRLRPRRRSMTTRRVATSATALARAAVEPRSASSASAASTSSPRDGVVHPIEVNPRWTASMELVERALRASRVFDAHADACARRRAARRPAVRAAGARAVGKAIVFARRGRALPATRATWLAARRRRHPAPVARASLRGEPGLHGVRRGGPTRLPATRRSCAAPACLRGSWRAWARAGPA